MKILKRYPDTRRFGPTAIVELQGRLLQLRYDYLTEEDLAAYACILVHDARSHVSIGTGSGMLCRNGVRCIVTGRPAAGGYPRRIDLPLDGDPDETFDRFLRELPALLAEAVL